MSQTDFSVQQRGKWTTVRVNGLLHLAVRDVHAVQSWISEQEPPKYCVEFSTPQGNVLSEYDTEKKWKFLLKEIDLWMNQICTLE